MTTADVLHRLNHESRARLAGAEHLREQSQLATRHSRLRLEASRRLLDQGRRTAPDPARV